MTTFLLIAILFTLVFGSLAAQRVIFAPVLFAIIAVCRTLKFIKLLVLYVSGAALLCVAVYLALLGLEVVGNWCSSLAEIYAHALGNREAAEWLVFGTILTAVIICIACIVRMLPSRRRTRLEAKRDRLERRERGEPVTALEKLRYEFRLNKERKLDQQRADEDAGVRDEEQRWIENIRRDYPRWTTGPAERP